MGLDMYLYAEISVDKYNYENKDGKYVREDNPNFEKANALMRGLPTGEYGGISLTKCVAYWRKANAIHGWIVRNCANGVDECQRIEMSREDLINLRDVCVESLKDRDKAIPSRDNTIELNGNGVSDETTVMSIIEAMKAQSANIGKVSVVDSSDPIPPIAGFFFGGTEKDDYYYHYLAETVETINSILASSIGEEYSFYYQASW